MQRPLLGRKVEAGEDDDIVEAVRPALSREAVDRKRGSPIGPYAGLDGVQHVGDPDGLTAAGIKVWPSEGNFVLADFGTPAKAKAADEAMRARGLIVRAMGGYGLPQCLRITIGTAEECTMVIDALMAFMHG